MIFLAGSPQRPAEDIDPAVLTRAFRKAAFPRKNRMIDVVLHVARHEKIKKAVMIIVAPCGTCGPATKTDTSFSGNVSKSAIVIVVIQPILAVVGDVDVRPSIVVVVADGNAKAPPFVGNTSFFGNVGKCAVVVVVKEHGVGSRLLAFHRGDR